MNFEEQEAYRQWLGTALGELHAYVAQDSDFRGNRDYELRALAHQRQYVADGKYRVVFLGAFNVGKSTAINAFLGGGFLPMDVEECTTRLTFIQRGPRLETRVRLTDEPAPAEMAALEQALSTIPAEVSFGESRAEIVVGYPEPTPRAMRESLEALITVLADEAYPQLASLREKLVDITLSLPAEALQEDILFVDTPGVHSISETRQQITYDVIDRSHLVISFVDSSFAGNVHDLNFVKRIMKWRGRQVFFVLNKADKLEGAMRTNADGEPAIRALREAFKRNGLPEDGQIFLLSGYRALHGVKLLQGECSLEDLAEDNRLGLDPDVENAARTSEAPEREVARHLLEQSHFLALKEELLRFLANEDRMAAVLASASHFLRLRADNFVMPLEHELRLAEDPSQFEALREHRQELGERLKLIRSEAEKAIQAFRVRSKGGRLNGTLHPGYARRIRDHFTADKVREGIIAPTLAWLSEPGRLAEARRQRLAPVAARLEHHVDEFVSAAVQELQAELRAEEQLLEDALAGLLSEVRGLRMQFSQAPLQARQYRGAIQTALENSAQAGAAIVGAAAGAAAGSVIPVIGTIIGAGLGGMLGALSGLLGRLGWSEKRWMRQVETLVRDTALNVVLRGAVRPDGRDAPVVEIMIAHIHQHVDTYALAVRAEMDNAVTSLQREIDDLLAREEEIRRESESIIARLAPKVSLLGKMRELAGTWLERRHAREAA